MKPMNRRSFFTKAVGMFGLLSIPIYETHMTIIPELATSSGLVTIDAAGLEPHLEAFMWEILEHIQVRASMEGPGAFMLGR